MNVRSNERQDRRNAATQELETRELRVTRLGAAVAIALVAIGNIAQAVVITPTSATATSSIDAARTLTKTIDSSGLTSAGDISTWTHVSSDTGGVYWLGAIADAQVLTYTLSGPTDIGAIHYWQYNRSNTSWNTRGINTADISFSTDGGSNYSTPFQVSFALGNSGGIESTQTAEFVVQSGVTDIRLTNLANFGDPTWFGVSEVRFDTEGLAPPTIPEPSTALLGLLSCVGLTLRRRRRRT